jgi:trk system potassium uptake protein TrkA
MQIIIIGCGKVGSSLARQLVALEHDVVIIESDSKLMLQADDIDCIKITGVPIDRDVLRQAGIETADVVCCVTQVDNINIMSSQIAQDVFHVPKIITRIFNPVNKDVFDEFGLNTICSTELTVDAFLREIEGEQNTQVHQLYGTPVVYSTVATDREIYGDNVCDLSTDTGKMVIGLIRKGRLMLAIPGLKVQEGDQLVLADLQ